MSTVSSRVLSSLSAKPDLLLDYHVRRAGHRKPYDCEFIWLIVHPPQAIYARKVLLASVFFADAFVWQVVAGRVN